MNNLNKTGLLDLFIKKNEKSEITIDNKGNPVPDAELRDTELIPLTYEGGLDAFIKKEVLPYHEDAWVDENSVQVGYEINFTKYFYEPKKLPSVIEIVEEKKILERESEGLMGTILEGLDYEI